MNWDDGNWYDVTQYGERISGWITGFFFLLGRMAIQVTLWLLHWAYRFNIRDYSDLAEELGDRYDREIVGAWGLREIAWFFLVIYVGFLAIRRRVGAAGGELLLSVVLLGLATVMIAQPSMYVDSIADSVDLASNDMLATARPQEVDDPGGEEPEDDEEADLLAQACSRWGEGHDLDAMLCQLHVEFVERPYLYLNVGTEHLEGGCFTAVQNVLSTGRDEDGWPARYMERAGCPREVLEWNRGVSGTRMIERVDDGAGGVHRRDVPGAARLHRPRGEVPHRDAVRPASLRADRRGAPRVGAADRVVVGGDDGPVHRDGPGDERPPVAPHAQPDRAHPAHRCRSSTSSSGGA